MIRNAGDVAPKGEFVFRPATVDVEVLEPIDTSAWQAANLDQHVREVRNLFLRSLGQPLDDAPARAAATRPLPGGKTKAKAKPKPKPKAKAKAKAKTGAAVQAKAKTEPKARPKTRPKAKAGAGAGKAGPRVRKS